MTEVTRYDLTEDVNTGVVDITPVPESMEGRYVGYEDYAELKAQCVALAAENAMLKSNLMFWDAEDPEAPYDHPEEIANNCCMDLGTEFDVQVAAKMPDRTYRVSAVGDYDCTVELVSGGAPETPATDAYLNSVRAEGVEMFAKHFNCADINDEILDFAAQIRAGESS